MKYEDILNEKFLNLIKSIKGYENIVDKEEVFFKRIKSSLRNKKKK